MAELGFCSECRAVAFELSRIDNGARGLDLPGVVEVVPSMVDNADVCFPCEHDRMAKADLAALASRLDAESAELLPRWVAAIAVGAQPPPYLTFRAANLLLLEHYRSTQEGKP